MVKTTKQVIFSTKYSSKIGIPTGDLYRKHVGLVEFVIRPHASLKCDALSVECVDLLLDLSSYKLGDNPYNWRIRWVYIYIMSIQPLASY